MNFRVWHKIRPTKTTLRQMHSVRWQLIQASRKQIIIFSGVRSIKTHLSLFMASELTNDINMNSEWICSERTHQPSHIKMSCKRSVCQLHVPVANVVSATMSWWITAAALPQNQRMYAVWHYLCQVKSALPHKRTASKCVQIPQSAISMCIVRKTRPCAAP